MKLSEGRSYYSKVKFNEELIACDNISVNVSKYLPNAATQQPKSIHLEVSYNLSVYSTETISASHHYFTTAP